MSDSGYIDVRRQFILKATPSKSIVLILNAKRGGTDEHLHGTANFEVRVQRKKNQNAQAYIL